MIMFRGLIILKLLFVLCISLSPLQSHADASSSSLLRIFRQLAAESGLIPNPKSPLQLSPSPTPSAAAPVDPPMTTTNREPVVTESCDKVSKKCHQKSITACLPLGLKGYFLLVLNDDDSSLKVDVTILPMNITYKEIYVPMHQATKVNISDNVVGNSSGDGNESCIIHMGADVPKDNFNRQLPSFDSYISPINGAYLLFVSALIIGGTCTYFKLCKRKRHLDGVPYQELEMGQSQFVSSMNVETAEGWDQGWDDDWDEEKVIKSPAANNVTSRTANGHTSRSSNSDGWGNDKV